MLADIAEHLICPVCSGGLEIGERVMRCAQGHSYDIAKQGYVSLLIGSQPPGTADSPAMVAARSDFLAAGHYAPLARALGDCLPRDSHVIVDAGTGTGYYLAAVLETAPQAMGLAFDVSKHAVKRAARAHARIGAFVADVWQPLPIADGAADVILDVFAPRNGPEFARVLRPGGALVVVTPARSHLSPLVHQLGLLSVDGDKETRVSQSLRGFVEVDRRTVEFEMELTREGVAEVVGMGPSAWHTEPAQLAARIAKFQEKTWTQAAFHLSTFQHAS
ncbi:putative RNA methyltransferase [Nonomuraea sp. NPDC050556]|uniref:putative RNA methyltransferase n=1 Tax=Nonomuraea sp. NPDC050556 TaxID=3364369 RepID=UPI0037ABC11C